MGSSVLVKVAMTATMTRRMGNNCVPSSCARRRASREICDDGNQEDNDGTRFLRRAAVMARVTDRSGAWL